MKNNSYWENRAAWDMYHRMQDAEETADQLARIYRNASMLLTNKAKDIFEKYMTKHGLSETQAWNLLNTMQDKNSLEELRNALKNKDSDKTKQELLQELEAPAYRARMERLQDLLQQMDTVMQNVYHQEQLFDTSFFQNLCEEVYYRSIYNIQRQTGLGFSFSNISQKQIDQVLSMNWSGKHYSQRIWKNTQDLSETLKQELLVSLLTGRTDRETSEVIMNRFGTGAMQARRLVRTESCFLSGELTARSYKECGIEKYRYLATLDLRTSEICRELDGKVFPLKERQAGKNYPPMHPWCRSMTISVIDEDVLRTMKRNAYNPEKGRSETVPANMTYTQWYEKYVKGNAKVEAEEKAIQNAASDRKQYERYQKILSKDVPKRLADFQEMKYNNPEKWKKLQLKYQDIQLQTKIRSEDYPKQIEEGKQGKHILGHDNYIEGRSYLTVDTNEIQELINKYAGTGRLQRDGQGHWNHKEVVTMGKNIGVYKDLKGKKLPTNIATIHYSKKGVHVVPAKPKEE